jgi:septum site-determining protein MinD
MTKFLAVAGKGGVGKTISAINLASALNNYGRNVVLVDASIKSPHIALHLGALKVKNTMHDALLGTKKIRDCAYSHVSGLYVIPGSLSPEKQDAAQTENIKKHLAQLEGCCELVIMDTGNDAADFENVMSAAHELLIVTTPDLPSVAEALKIISKARAKGITVAGAVVNRIRGLSSEMGMQNIQSMLGVPVISEIEEDRSVPESLVTRHPVVYSHPDSSASEGFKLLARKLIG